MVAVEHLGNRGHVPGGLVVELVGTSLRAVAVGPGRRNLHLSRIEEGADAAGAEDDVRRRVGPQHGAVDRGRATGHVEGAHPVGLLLLLRLPLASDGVGLGVGADGRRDAGRQGVQR